MIISLTTKKILIHSDSPDHISVNGVFLCNSLGKKTDIRTMRTLTSFSPNNYVPTLSVNNYMKYLEENHHRIICEDCMVALKKIDKEAYRKIDRNGRCVMWKS